MLMSAAACGFDGVVFDCSCRCQMIYESEWPMRYEWII